MCPIVSVGFEYESCLDLILWEKRTAILQGYELDASNMGGWTLDKHHILDLQNGEWSDVTKPDPTTNVSAHTYTDNVHTVEVLRGK